MSSDGAVLVALATFPDMGTARRVAEVLVGERLAACVNLIPGLESVFEWEGRVQTSGEVGGWIKTSVERFPALAERYRALHPYEVPALVTLRVEGGLDTYLDWVRASLG
ncbi:MAG: hypothetical protein RLZZ399_1823 [Verrucomicrobiota bacterium]|jgi:periplasmic divalent cation tolerance protein